MPDTPAPMRRTTATSAAALVRPYLLSRGDRLAMALERLGGRPAFSRLIRLREGLRRGRVSARRIETELRYMHELLTLEHVGDPDRDESGFFAVIDPVDADVHDFCLLAEEIEGLLRRVRRLTASAAVDTRASSEPVPAPNADAGSATRTDAGIRIAA